MSESNVLTGPPLKLPNTSSAWAELKQHIRQYGHGIAQVDAPSGITATFNAILNRAVKVGQWLRKIGVQPRSVALIICPNSLDLTPLLLGAWTANVTCALINPASTESELQHVCNIVDPYIIIRRCLPSSITLSGTKYTELNTELNQILNESTDNQQECTHEDYAEDTNAARVSDIALILSSSGSTGLPKCVALAHSNVTAVLVSSNMFASHHTIALNVLPLFHAYGLLLMLMCLHQGSSFVILPKFSASTFLKSALDYKINTLYLVPSLLILLERALDDDPTKVTDALRNVRHIWTGAGPVCSKLQLRMSHVLPGHPIMYHSYGLTETTFTVLAGASRPCEKPGSPGTTMPGLQCKIISSDGTPLGPDSVGELLVRGPTLMNGYLRNEAATLESLDADGWLHTGDLAKYDADGWFFLVDRIKEIIKYHGHQVSPSELEAVICTVPGVLEAAVVGIPDSICGELPAALVVCKSGNVVTEESIHSTIFGELCAYKQLRGGIFYVTKIPKTPSGKILRRQARTLCLSMVTPQLGTDWNSNATLTYQIPKVERMCVLRSYSDTENMPLSKTKLVTLYDNPNGQHDESGRDFGTIVQQEPSRPPQQLPQNYTSTQNDITHRPNFCNAFLLVYQKYSLAGILLLLLTILGIKSFFNSRQL